MTALAEKGTDRLARAKRQLAGLIAEAFAHLRECDDNTLVGPLIGLGIQAAELAASLGFPTPPIEHPLAKPDEVGVFVPNPYYDCLSGMRFHYPEGCHRFDIRVTPPGSTDMMTSILKEVSMWAARWQGALERGGLAEPEAVRVATESYRGEQDTVRRFLNECCVLEPNRRTAAGDFHERFVSWSGERISMKRLNDRMREMGYALSDRSTGGRRFWNGIGLSESDPSDPNEAAE